MTSKSLKWNGKALTERMRTAQKLAVNKTMADCVIHAKANHDWINRTGVLEGSIDIATFAREAGNGVEGTWGSQDVIYARIHELGGTIVPREKEALKFQLPDGSWQLARSVTIPPRPYLRPAADVVYPQLAGNVRKAFESLGGGGAPQGGASA